MALPEDKREKVRLPSDGLLHGEWHNLNRSVYPGRLEEDIEALNAMKRAHLTRLDLSEYDKEFLKSLRIAI